MSPRVVQRRLQSEGTTFQALLDAVCREAAEAALRDPERSLCEIAQALGFAEQSAFQRAFRRWKGQTPKQFRRPHGSEVVL